MFQGRKLSVATKHKKEEVIAPILEKEFGVQCYTSNSFDTDLLGTFSGEVPRKEDALTTLRTKCFLSLDSTNCDLVVASEGSFGSHPVIFFAQANEEIIMLMDTKINLEIVVREISTETNFNASEVKNEIELMEFASKVKFPSHGLILKPSENDFSKIVKGITDEATLKKNFKEMIDEFGTAYVETDMRALFNPTRMKLIEKAAVKLVKAIQSKCPVCETPGFVTSESKPGLPCDLCHFPTRSILSHISKCKKCDYTLEQLYPNKKITEDPMYCDFCNP